jgi:hypothetical protein
MCGHRSEAKKNFTASAGTDGAAFFAYRASLKKLHRDALPAGDSDGGFVLRRGVNLTLIVQ